MKKIYHAFLFFCSLLIFVSELKLSQSQNTENGKLQCYFCRDNLFRSIDFLGYLCGCMCNFIITEYKVVKGH